MGRLTRSRDIRAAPARSTESARPDRRAAFTLVETLMALTILAVGLLAMLGLQLQALKQAGSGRHGTQAAILVRNQLETFNRMDWSDAALQPTAGWTAPVARTTTVQSAEGDKDVQAFNLSWRITADATDVNLRHIDVRATWRESNQAAGSPDRRYVVSSIRYNN